MATSSANAQSLAETIAGAFKTSTNAVITAKCQAFSIHWGLESKFNELTRQAARLALVQQIATDEKLTASDIITWSEECDREASAVPLLVSLAPAQVVSEFKASQLASERLVQVLRDANPSGEDLLDSKVLYSLRSTSSRTLL